MLDKPVQYTMGQFKKEVPYANDCKNETDGLSTLPCVCHARTGMGKDFGAFGVALVRRLIAATAAVNLASLFTEWLCYVLGRLYSS